MKPIKMTLALFTLTLTALWAASALPGLDTTDSHALGVAFTQFTGILSIAMMAFANLLAVRPKLIEPTLDGLDKMYRLHKWLGIGGLGFGVVHG